MAHAGLRDIEAARKSFDTALQLAPQMMSHRLDEGVPTRGAAIRQRTRMLMGVAAGLEDPSSADALR